MIINGNRFVVQTQNGESDILVLLAIAQAAYQMAPRGLDSGREYVMDRFHELEAEEIAEDMIQFTPRGVELVMNEVRGRACMTHVAPVSGLKGQFEVNRDLFEGSILELLERTEMLLRRDSGMDVVSGIRSTASLQ